MYKNTFLRHLRRSLQGLSSADINDSVAYYSEMIDDKIEAGMSEADAVLAMGEPEDIAKEILLGLPLSKIIKSRCKPRRRLKGWEIAMIAVGSPIWITLIAVMLAVLICIFATVWSVVAVAWSVDISLFVTGIASIIPMIESFISAPIIAMLYFGLALTMLAISVILFFGCIKLTRLFVKFSMQIVKFLKKIIIGNKNSKSQRGIEK